MGARMTDQLAEQLAGERPVKRSLSLSGHRTSVTLEPVFWEALTAMARERGLSLNGVANVVDRARAPEHGLASALRVAAMRWATLNRS